MERMPSGSSRTVPLKGLLVLTFAVLLVHFALLQASPMALGLDPTPPPRAFITRAIAPIPSGQTAAVQPVPPAVRPKRKVPAASPMPAEVRTSSSEAAPAPSAMDETKTPDPNAGGIATTQGDAPADADPQASAPHPPRDQLATLGAVTVPVSGRFKYQVETNKFPFSAKAELRWQHDGEHYDARLEFSAFGLARVQNSRGRITPEGLAPVRFSDKYRNEFAAHFNREQGKVTFSANTPNAPLLAGAQDRLSILVQLAAMLAGDPGHYPPATTIALQAVGPRDADIWLFTVGDAETLSLPGGEQLTLKLVRNPRREFDQKVEVWLAPALGYLPARVRITDANGDFVDQKWLTAEPLS